MEVGGEDFLRRGGISKKNELLRFKEKQFLADERERKLKKGNPLSSGRVKRVQSKKCRRNKCYNRG